MIEEIHDFGTTVIITNKKLHINYEIRKYSNKPYIVYCGNCSLHISKNLEHMHVIRRKTHHKNEHGLIIPSNQILQDIYLCPYCIRELKARKLKPKALLALLKIKEIVS